MFKLPYKSQKGFLKKRKTQFLEEAELRTYPNGNIVVHKGEYTFMEVKAIEGQPTRFTVETNDERDPTYSEFFITE
jgi:formyltetrahydrofolate synthetase